jgi:ribosomal protein S6--L-glutamate ligase
MIAIIPKPTDTHDDNSTSMVIRELELAGTPFCVINLEEVDPFACEVQDSVIWACGMSQDDHAFESYCALSLVNRAVNTPQALYTCASKVQTSALLVRKGIPTPTTSFTASWEMAGKFISCMGKAVSKPVFGFDGKGIILVRRPGDLGDPPYYLQEFIPNDRDYRVFVIDGEAVGAIERRSDSLTHNIHQGGIGLPVPVDPDMAAISVAATDAVGADYAGVDLLIHEGGYTVLEVNGTPNWHCMAVPVPRLLADYLARIDNEY